MDVLPPDNNDPFNLATMLRAFACAILGVIGSSFSALDKEVKGRQMFWHMGLAFCIAGLSFCTAVAMWPHIHWLVWPLPCFVLGLLIFGIAVAFRRGDKTVGDTDLIRIVKKKTGFDDKE